MTAQPLHTLTGVGFEVYDAPYAPDYDWPALEYPAPLTTPQIVRKPRKQRAPIRVVGMDGVVHPADDDTLADVLAAVIPCRALDPDPQPLVFTTERLPIDEPRTIEPEQLVGYIQSLTDIERRAQLDALFASTPAPAVDGFCLNPGAVKADGLLALHKYTERTKLRIPMGQRVLSPLHVRWSIGLQDFVYSFQIMENAVKWYVESELVEVKE